MECRDITRLNARSTTGAETLFLNGAVSQNFLKTTRRFNCLPIAVELSATGLV